jgi:hypothetical protein
MSWERAVIMHHTAKLTRRHVQTAITCLILLCIFFATQKTGSRAQGTSLTCAQLVPLVQKNLASNCQNMDRDEICLGYPTVAVQFQDGKAGQTFKQVGDIVPINTVKSITTAPLNLEHGEWGLAVLKTQAVVPNTTAGQAVTFVLYGDTTLKTSPAQAASANQPSVNCTATTTRATSLSAKPGANQPNLKALTPGTELKVSGRLADKSWVLVDAKGSVGWLSASAVKLTCDAGALPQVNPDAPAVLAEMGAFYFSTGVSAQAECKDVPSGLMIQSPAGSTIRFRVNGVNLTIGSSVVLRAQPKQKMQVAVLKGKAVLETDDGKEEVITSGEESFISLGGDDGLTADGAPEDSEKIDDPSLNTDTVCGIVDSVDSADLCSSEPAESNPQSDENGQNGGENTGQNGENGPNPDENNQENGGSNGQDSGNPDGSSINEGGSGGDSGTDSGNPGEVSGGDSGSGE